MVFVDAVEEARAKDLPGVDFLRYKTGRQCRSTTFPTRVAAEEFRGIVERFGPERALELVGLELRTSKLVAKAIGTSFDPSGYFVYLLWGEGDTDRPLYVGQSANILARLGQHIGATHKRQLVRRVQLIKCDDRETMNTTEEQLIRQFHPVWNIAGNLGLGGVADA